MAFDAEIREQLLDTIRRFVSERLRPLEARVAEEDRVPDDVLQEMKDMGLFGLSIPAEYGGLDLSIPWTIGLCGILLAGMVSGSNVALIYAVPLVLLVGAAISFVNGFGQGGAIYAADGDTTLNFSTVSSNTAADGGRGLYVSSSGAAVEYEPGEEEILADLLPRNVTIQIFKGLLENAASEQGASMTAMDNATRNAGELINKLTIVYNRTRQAAITTELIEIIAGAEAL